MSSIQPAEQTPAIHGSMRTIEFKHLAEAALEAGTGSAAAEVFKAFATPENILALVAEVERERSKGIQHHKRFLALAGDLARAGDKVLSDTAVGAAGEGLTEIQAGVDTRNRVINELRALLEDVTQQRDKALSDCADEHALRLHAESVGDTLAKGLASPHAFNALCWVRQTAFADDLERALRAHADPELATDIAAAFRFSSHKDIVRFYEEYAYAPGNTQWQMALAGYLSARIVEYAKYDTIAAPS